MAGSQGTIDSGSTVVEVTVYSDRALVTREARLALPTGESLVVFEPLPDDMDAESVQLSGSGARLKDIAWKRLSYDEVPEEEKRRLEREARDLSDSARETEERKAQAKSERAFVEKIAAKLTAAESGKPGAQEFSPDAWVKMVEFYRSRIGALDAEIRERDAELRELGERRATLEARLAAAGGRGSRERNRVEAIVERGADEKGECVLRLSYVVMGPSWRPVYDVRASMEKRVVAIAYQAMVSQNSGEAWDGVSLRLSTARPAVSGTVPVLNPWRLSAWVPPPQAYRGGAPKSKRMMVAAKEAAFDEVASSAPAPAVMADADDYDEAPMEYEAAEIEGSGARVVFIVPGGAGIPSDGEPHRVGVSFEEFPAEFSYVIVPKVQDRAFLVAKVKNRGKSPFLQGRSRIFLDNAFIAEASFGPVMPDEEFTASLGADDAMQAEYRLVKKFDATAGLGGKRKRIEFEYKIVVKNKRSTKEKLEIKDCFPVSGHEDIVVKEQKPDAKEWGDRMERDDSGRFVIKAEVGPGEEKAVDVAYVVEYPRDLRITGL